jgi:hypothetical protein
MKTYEWPLSPEQLTELFNSELVTFDLFETLICRKGGATEPFKVYGVLGSFFRQSFELGWRVVQKIGIAKEFKLEYLRPFLGQRISDEFDFDLNQLLPRYSMLELMDSLLERKTQVAIVTNSYYSFSQISQICDKVGIPGELLKIVSSEYGVTKAKGLFRDAYESPITSHWHFGDNQKEDSAVSRDVFVIVPKIWDRDPIGLFSGSFLSKRDPEIIRLRGFLTEILAKHENSMTPWFWFGVCCSGPLSISIGQKLLQVMEEEKSKTIYFLARDGYLPFLFFRSMTVSPSVYLPYSRKVSQSPNNLEILRSWISYSGSNEKRIFFDLGWRGVSASKLVSSLGNEARLVLFGRWPWHRKIEHRHLFFGGIFTLKNAIKVRKCPELFELAMSAPHDSFEALPENLDVSLELYLNENVDTRRQIIDGAIHFQQNWIKNEMPNLSLNVGTLPILDLMTSPSLTFLHLAASEFHEYRGEKISLVVGSHETITYWIKGSWRYQKFLKISLIKRAQNVTKECSRRLRFGHNIGARPIKETQ